jgi:hypothetical protein
VSNSPGLEGAASRSIRRAPERCTRFRECRRTTPARSATPCSARSTRRPKRLARCVRGTARAAERTGRGAPAVARRHADLRRPSRDLAACGHMPATQQQAEAREWLRAALAGRARQATEVQAEVEERGYTEKVIRTAREALGIVCVLGARGQEDPAQASTRSAAAKTRREDAASAVRQGRMRAPTTTTLREAADALIAGMRDGSVLDRWARPTSPPRSAATGGCCACACCPRSGMCA